MNKNRQTSHLTNVLSYDLDGNIVLLHTPSGTDNSARIPTTAWVRTYVTGLTYATQSYVSTQLGSYVTLSGQQTISGIKTFSNEQLFGNGITLQGGYITYTSGSYNLTLNTNILTANRNIFLKDGSGTLAFVSDIPSLAGYATEAYVGTAISNLVASAPATLDTLNELAAALGNDASFATTITTSIGTKVPQSRTITINGTAYDLSADRAWTIATADSTKLPLAGGTMTGQIVTPSTGSDVYGGAIQIRERGYVLESQSAWSYSPAITFHWGNRWAKRFGGRADGLFAVDDEPIALRSWVTAQAYLTGITSAQVTTALGYTPYNSTNPSGYITSSGTAAAISQTIGANGDTNLVYAAIADNDFFRIRVGGASNAGWVEIATADDGTEPIYVRQYTGVFSSLTRTATLLDGSGNTSFPGTVTAPTFSGALSGNATTASSISGFGNPSTSSSPSTIVYRDGNGDIVSRYSFGSYVNTSDDINAANITYIMAKFGDNYHRSASAERVKAFLGLGSAAYFGTSAFLSSVGSVEIGGYLTVGGSGTSSSIYMKDTDEGNREIHCNSNRIGFLTQAGAWGAWLYDGADWEAASSVRAPIFYDSNDTGYYADFNTTSNTGIRLRGGILMGPNPTWGAYLQVGGNGNETDYATVAATDGNLHIDSAVGKALYLNYYHNGTIYLNGTTYSISSNGSYYNGTAASASNADTLDGYHGSNYPGKNGNSYYQADTWIQCNGYHGLYAPSWNGAHFYPNDSSYGAWKILGSRNGWRGIHFGEGTGMTLMMNETEFGFHREAHGWYARFTNGRFYGACDNVYNLDYALGNTHYWTAINYFQTNNGGQAVNNSNSAKLEAYSTGNNSAFMSFHKGGHYAINMGLDDDNVFRIGGWSASGNRLQMDMSGNLTMAGDVTAYSDARVKENIKIIENALDKVLALRGVSYNRIDSDDKKTKIGVIAQETLQVVPEVVNQDNHGMYNVSYGNMAGLFIEAFKEQQKQIEELKSIINGLTK